MLYAHAASFVPSEFAGIGSYLSLYAQIGDEVTIYTRDKDGRYTPRTYMVTKKQEVAPTQTAILDEFSGI